MITRDEILARAHAVPLRSDEYSQNRLDGDGANAKYRPDCSGWVSYCWGVPTSGPGTWGGYSTATFITTDYAPGVHGIMYEIPRGELQPGDAIGHCGPTTGGNGGHIALWLGKGGNGTEHIIDMPGGWGPIDHTTVWGGGSGDSWNAPGNIRAFRFRGVEGATGGGAVNLPVTPAVIAPGAAFPLPANEWYGDINGPDASHGGFHASEMPTVAAIQLALIAGGFVPGITAADKADATAWSDGRFEQPTIDAVKRFQAAHGLEVDGQVGPKTWAAMFPAVVTPPPAPEPEPEPEPVPVPEPGPEPTPVPSTVDVAALAAALAPLLLPQLVAAMRAAAPSYTLTPVSEG
jgi:hypothetical protein